MTREIHNVLFDLDGTLVDSSAAIRASLGYALERLGLYYPDHVPVESFIGTPLLEIFGERLGVPGGRVEAAIGLYRDHYHEHAQDGTRVYDRVPELLRGLTAQGIGLYVATVKPATIAGKVLRDMNLLPHFSGVAGSSMDHARRDKAGIIRHALDNHGLEARHSVMIGDRGQDIAGAHANGLYAVGVSYGYGSLDELRAAGPDHIVDSAPAIAPLITTTIGRN